jgi:mRNA-degrading endonuclease RelE of RelBE toxin-antitoxin system
MRIVRTPKFQKMFERLPPSVRQRYEAQEHVLAANPKDARLHLKKLRGGFDTYSFRITRSYRALFILEGNTAWLFAIGDRKDIYR